VLFAGGAMAQHNARHRVISAAGASAHTTITPPQSAPAAVGSPAAVPLKELSGAVPAHEVAKLPSTSAQYRALKAEIDKSRPAVEIAKRRSALLEEEASDLRRRLIDSTARVQALEEEKGRIDAELVRLVPEERAMADAFANDRSKVARLLAVLERLQSDMPPVVALRADDALRATRGAMLLGASLPRIYKEAAELAERLHALRRERAELFARRQEGARNTARLSDARIDLDQLLAIKAQEADEASAQYGDLQSRLDAAAEEAANLGSLLAKVAQLRLRPAGQGIVVVSAGNEPDTDNLRRNSLCNPVAGPAVAGGTDSTGGQRAPGISFLAAPGAKVVSPSDGEVLFADSYHKTGKVLILETTGGYDLVLAGLETVDVRPGDELLAGEPVGAMPRAGAGARLYFELRQNGKGVSPAPWMEVELRKAKRT
jgi:septal ring factor EnvC (AmiA/AmiB activator)